MAIKLTTNNTMPSAVSSLELISANDTASISLSTEKIREQVGGEWVESPTKCRQTITFIGANGSPCTFDGVVAESDAVEIAAAYKVVLTVTLENELKAAYQAGRKSQAYTSLGIVKVTEVWDTPAKCLWRAQDEAKPGSGKAVMDDSGKIVRK